MTPSPQPLSNVFHYRSIIPYFIGALQVNLSQPDFAGKGSGSARCPACIWEGEKKAPESLPEKQSPAVVIYPSARSATMYAAVPSTILGSVLCFHLYESAAASTPIACGMPMRTGLAKPSFRQYTTSTAIIAPGSASPSLASQPGVDR